MKNSERIGSVSNGPLMLGSAPCIFDLCLQLQRSEAISQEVHVNALPQCVGCGACATLCPNGGIQVEDHDGERTLSVRGDVVVRIHLQKCEGCGLYHAPSIFLEQLPKLVSVSGEIMETRLCPGCKRVAHAAAMIGSQPDFEWIRKAK